MLFRGTIACFAFSAYTVSSNPIENVTAVSENVTVLTGNDTAPQYSSSFNSTNLTINGTSVDYEDTLTSVHIDYLPEQVSRPSSSFQMGLLYAISELAIRENGEKIRDVAFARHTKPYTVFFFTDTSGLTNVALLIEVLSLLNKQLKADDKWIPFTFKVFFNNGRVGFGSMQVNQRPPYNDEIIDTPVIGGNQSGSSDPDGSLPLRNLTHQSVETSPMTSRSVSQLQKRRSVFTVKVNFDQGPTATRYGAFVVLDELVTLSAIITRLPKTGQLRDYEIWSGDRIQLRQEILPGFKEFQVYYVLLSIWKLAQVMYDFDIWIGADVTQNLDGDGIGFLVLESPSPMNGLSNGTTSQGGSTSA